MSVPTTAMLLAAGLGLRMRPLTLARPKPLVRVAGRTLLDWTLDSVAAAGVTRAVVNVHHFAPMITAHIASRVRPEIVISDETELLLETGGGVVKALSLLGEAPFFVLNCDAVIKDRNMPALKRLAEAWDPQSHDVMMLLHPRETAHGFDGAGDFFLRPDGGLVRRGAAATAPFVYAGAYVMHPRILAGEAAVPFSMNRIWDRVIAQGRMHGIVHDGDWFHVGTPDAVSATERLLGVKETVIS